jgi:hypothetical protein
MLRKVVVTLGITLGLAQVSHAQRSTFFNMNVRPASTGVPTHIQSCAVQASGTVSSVTATCPNAIGAGHFLYACVTNANGTPFTITWSGDSGTFTGDVTNLLWNGGSSLISCFYVPTTGGGSLNLTATGSNLYYPAITVDEFSNVGALDVSDAGASGTGTAAASNSITPSTNGDLIIGLIANVGGGATIAHGTGYTLGANSTYPSVNEYQVQATAAAITATGTNSTSLNWVAHVVAFKP